MRRAVNPSTALAHTRMTAFAGMVLCAMFVDSVWFHAIVLSVLLWLTIGAVPTVVKWRPTGYGASIGPIVLSAVSSVSQSWYLSRRAAELAVEKRRHPNQLRRAAHALKAAGAKCTYGSYYDVIPVGYASAQHFRTISNPYDCFPLQDKERVQSYVVVGVRDVHDGYWGEEALAHLEGQCSPPQPKVTTAVGTFLVLTSPKAAIDTGLDS